MTLRSTILLLLTASIISCSIKEERSECPCRLTIDLSDASEVFGPASVYIWERTKLLCSETIPITGRSASFVKDVTKCRLEVSAIQGLTDSRIVGRNVIIPYGHDADRLMVYGNEILCDKEQIIEKATLVKNWTTLTIEYSNQEGKEYPYDFIVTGDIQGFDIYSTTPVAGKFQCKAKKLSTWHTGTSVDLPRQFANGEGLELTLLSKKTGKEEIKYNLSDIINQTGFRWDSTNLNDIRIYINYAGLMAGIKITDWENGADISVII